MSYKILAIPPFDKQLKRLAKKYASLKKEYAGLIASLEKDPEQGTPIGKNCFKIRLAIASKGKGKSGGARVITYVKVVAKKVYLSYIYDKNEKDSISNKELQQVFEKIP